MSGAPFDAFKNADGTYNGVALFSEMTGLSQAEIRWTFDRLKHLLHVEKLSKADAVAQIRQEAAAKPWLQPSHDQAGGPTT